MTAPSGTPARDKVRLRQALREARDARKFTQKEVADAMEWSLSKIVRIESGRVGISITDLKALLLQYEVTDKDRVGNLVKLARAAKQESWWRKYRDHYPREFLTFLELEESSVRLRQFQIVVVPGILQTPEYAKTLIYTDRVAVERADRGYAIRMKRQELISDDGPEMFFILDESVLHRQIGSDEVMRGQLLKLKELADHPNLSIQILPFSAGVHPGMRGSFEIFELSQDPSHYALLLEGVHKDTLLEETSNETKEYVDTFIELERIALPKTETPRIIDERLSQMT